MENIKEGDAIIVLSSGSFDAKVISIFENTIEVDTRYYGRAVFNKKYLIEQKNIFNIYHPVRSVIETNYCVDIKNLGKID